MRKSRIEAMEAGEKYYKTGKKCKYGHSSKRITYDGSCYKCRMVNQKKAREIFKVKMEQVAQGSN